ARDVTNGFARIDPILHAVYRRTAVLLYKTGETRRRIPAKYQTQCFPCSELGIEVRGAEALPDRERREGPFRVLFAGRLLHWKGVHLGLEAFARFHEASPNSRFTLIGQGPEGARWRKMARRLGIEDAVIWVPWIEREKVMEAYRRHDVLLFPSLHDSSGNVILEAFSCSLPVICLDLGGPAMLVDASCGIRVGARRVEEAIEGLTQALARLAGDRELARRMGKAGFRRVRDEFSWAAKVARMEGFYRRAVSKSNVPIEPNSSESRVL
ncbi:MAG: glycosyltransferase family 4 protein, partial [Terriglobia bacterium]